MKLYKHQQALVDLAPRRWLLAWEVGTGKSLGAIELSKKIGKTTLVICPKSIKVQWEKDVPATWPVLTKEEFKKHALGIPPYNTLITDEAQYFSNYKSQMTKALLKYIRVRKPKNIYLLTGTPYLSSIWNIYSLGLILGMQHRKSWWTWPFFRNNFFNMIPMGRRKIPVQVRTYKGRPIEDAVAELVNMMGNTVRMDECVDVPEQIFQEEYFDLTKEQLKAIEDLDDTEPIVRWTHTHCIENGILKGDGYVEDKIFKSEKTNRVLELCVEHKKIAIVARYNLQLELYKKLLEKGGKRVFLINGRLKDKYSAVNQINKLKECVVLIQSATCEGYNMWSVPIMVFASMDFSLKSWIQMSGRIQRVNHVKKNVYKFLLIDKKSIDYAVYNNVVNMKQDFQIKIFDKS